MRSGDREEVLRRLPWLLGERVAAVERAEQDLRECVRDLVLAGYSWADVGRMLGVSRQAVRKRFGSEVDLWREHMGNRLPWDDWAEQLLDLGDSELVEFLGQRSRLGDSGPTEDTR